jgi:hypothetical protein
MITLPKYIEATGFECLVSCVTMVAMYWRNQKPNMHWTMPHNFDDDDWKKMFNGGLKYVKSSGVPFNSITRYLKSLNLPLKATLELLADIYELDKLMDLNIPPIVIYDRYFMLRGIKMTPFHSVVLIDKTPETFVVIDPSLAPKFRVSLPKTDFKEAWKITQNATIIIAPQTYKVRRRKIPSITLEKWVGKNVIQTSS